MRTVRASLLSHEKLILRLQKKKFSTPKRKSKG